MFRGSESDYWQPWRDGFAALARDTDLRLREVGAVGLEEAERRIAEAAPPKYTRFHGTIRLDATRLGRDAGKVAEEIVKHLAGLVDAEVEVTLEIQVDFPDGVPEGVIRVVTENSRTLKFTTAGFEEE